MRISLGQREWEFDDSSPLGEAGGFGKVFGGQCTRVGKIAVKRFHSHIGLDAKRELKVADHLLGKTFAHVIPVFDFGYDDDSQSHYIVMPRAETNLEEKISLDGPCTDDEAIAILLQIASGLLELPEIVHRDLKPGNVLFHGDKWKLADFGLARFIAAQTSVNTMRNWLSDLYAAPEQWDYEHVSNATDVYALGCIGYFLKTGSPPFTGSHEELKTQHLTSPPPSIPGASPELGGLLIQMLRKKPILRIPLFDLTKELERLNHNLECHRTPNTLNKLAAIARKIAESQIEEESKAIASDRHSRSRSELATEAIEIFRYEIAEQFIDRISSASPMIKRIPNLLQIDLGDASLNIHVINHSFSPEDFQRSKWDVIAGAWIVVRQHRPAYIWSSSLWLTDLGKGVRHRWYEVSYMTNPLLGRRRDFQPFHLENSHEADSAASPSMGSIQFAYGPRAIDGDDFESFANRWTDRFAVACEGKLTTPRYLPLIGD